MRTSPKGRAFIGTQEGLRLHAYQDAKGVWTIGYGHTSMAGTPHVSPGLIISAEEATQILARDLTKFEQQVLAEVKHALNQNQFDALVSFTYNLGAGNLRDLVRDSGLNQGNVAAVPRHMTAYDRAGGHLLADLVRRRAAEAAMFAHGIYPA